jgi:hypothetical protein
MIAKVFVKRCRDKVFDRSFYRVSGESCAQSFSKALKTASIISGVAE